MFNNIVLDVFIGLVLIYLLYSLFTTIISEMIATWMGLRSRVLRVAIEKMLNDGYHHKKVKNRSIQKRIWDFVQQYFLKEFDDFKHSFAGRFYDAPSIKYLSNKGGEQASFFSQTKPSYISDNAFADTLIQLLKDKGTGATDMDKVSFCLSFNTQYLEPATLKQISDLAGNPGNDIEVFKDKIRKWYNETMDRTTGWYKRKFQLILFWLGFLVAAAFNVDTIRITKLLSKDTDARAQLVTMGIQVSKDSARYAAFVNDQGDSVRSQAILDSGYSQITKDISEANMLLGLGWQTDALRRLRVDSFAINSDSSKLQTFKKYDSLWSTLNDSADILQLKMETRTETMFSIMRSLKESAIDTMRIAFNIKSSPANRVLLNRKKATVQRVVKGLTDTLALLQAKNNADSFELSITTRKLSGIRKSINGTAKIPFREIDSIYLSSDGCMMIVKGTKNYSWYGKLGYIICNVFNPAKSTGIYITALMLSLGASFWFDLLKKLISIRGAGVKPEEKPPAEEPDDLPLQRTLATQAVISTPVIHPVGDLYDEALRLYGQQIMGIPGVKSVFKVCQKTAPQASFLQINVDTNITENEVRSRFKSLDIGNTSVDYEIDVSGVVTTHLGSKGCISNKSGKNGSGALGCILKRKGDKSLHLLSCWHVMKGDTEYSVEDDLEIILDHNDIDYAVRWGGNIKDQFDYGIAKCKPGTDVNFNGFLRTELNLSAPPRYRAIPKQDIVDQIDIKYYDWIKKKMVGGYILADTDKVSIYYPDKLRTLKDILVITNKDRKAISAEGNSGSIIFDNSNNAIGIIVGGDLKYTYAAKLSHIFNIHKEMELA